MAPEMSAEARTSLGIGLPVGYEEMDSVFTTLNPQKPGVRKAYYVAPVWQVRKRRRRVIGERLTGLLPATGGDQRYYFRKGFRLASAEDIERLLPERDDDDFDEWPPLPEQPPVGRVEPPHADAADVAAMMARIEALETALREKEEQESAQPQESEPEGEQSPSLDEPVKLDENGTPIVEHNEPEAESADAAEVKRGNKRSSR